ncbi:hypothetical protein L249_0186 [Ophiocordyceps polyrhachis-furcata BCC 54312]|uniref:Uncharacterized protein n=1 Tax=Ophiocordyceps polyrhachis-furcata BCC 54312 TaxID=1330021 RepID=A0A367LDC0_9HYPO|nr:hypothetical protein L249_0186 [Ophiocordyceps polyrhachis-furcata BCC 54312]
MAHSRHKYDDDAESHPTALDQTFSYYITQTGKLKASPSSQIQLQLSSPQQPQKSRTMLIITEDTNLKKREQLPIPCSLKSRAVFSTSNNSQRSRSEKAEKKKKNNNKIV